MALSRFTHSCTLLADSPAKRVSMRSWQMRSLQTSLKFQHRGQLNFFAQSIKRILSDTQLCDEYLELKISDCYTSRL